MEDQKLKKRQVVNIGITKCLMDHALGLTSNQVVLGASWREVISKSTQNNLSLYARRQFRKEEKEREERMRQPQTNYIDLCLSHHFHYFRLGRTPCELS